MGIAEVPVLPDEISRMLPEARGGGAAAATADEVRKFYETFTARPEGHKGHLRGFLSKYESVLAEGAGHHGEMMEIVGWAVREAIAGCHPAEETMNALRDAFCASVPRDGRREFDRMVESAVGDEWNGEAPKVEKVAPDEVTGGRISLGQFMGAGRVRLKPTLLPIYAKGETLEPVAAMLYKGLSHAFVGPPGSAKSLVAQGEAARIVQGGGKVLYLDYEDGPHTVAERFEDFGCTPEQVDAGLDYRNPTSTLSLADIDADYELIVLDGTNVCLGQYGKNADSNPEVADWYRIFVKPIIAHTGAAMVMLDHVVKSRDSRGEFALGAGNKMALLTGAQFVFEEDKKSPVAKGATGRTKITLTRKDRPGWLKAFAKGERDTNGSIHFCTAVFESSDSGSLRMTLYAEDAAEKQQSRAEMIRTDCAAAVGHAIDKSGGQVAQSRIWTVLGEERERFGWASRDRINEYLSSISADPTSPYARKGKGAPWARRDWSEYPGKFPVNE